MRGNFKTDNRGINNPNYKDGRKGTRLYRIYNNMLARCYNANTPNFKNYGGRGITVCREWLCDYKIFSEWALSNGYRDDLSIDRIDVNGNYEPNNCRWVTSYVQSNNTRRNNFITLNGETHTLKEWADNFGISEKTVRDRLKRGWSIEKSLVTPPDTKYRKKVVVE
jgi:hypothetical protein